MAVSGIIFQMITLFIMMFAGYLAARAGVISPSFRRGLSSLVLSTAFPCCIVSSVLQSGGAPGDMVVALGVSVAFFALLIALAAVLVCIVPTPKPERSLDQLMLVFTNLAFMGIPIIQAFYGAQGVAMLSMFLLVFNFLVFTYGVMLVSGNGSINLRQLVNPGVVSALIALLFGLTGWRLPSPVESALSSIGSINTPMAMMVIGSSLAHSDIRAAFSNPRLYRVSLLRLIVKRGLLRFVHMLMNVYIQVFRGTPMIVQAVVIYYGAQYAGVFMDTTFAAVFIISINTGAYMAEIIRGGIVSVDKGQFEAAHAIGMTHWQTMTTVVLPQAIRNILPSVGNELIVNIKDSSVLNVISVSELFFQAKSAAGTYYRYFEVYFIIAVIYLILTLTVSRILRAVEKKMDGPDNYVIHGSQSDSRADIKVSVENEKEAVKRWNA